MSDMKTQSTEQNKRYLTRESNIANMVTEKLDKNFKSVNNYANNRNQPSLKTLNDIASVLQMNIKELLK